VKSYRLYVIPSAWIELRRLPGNVRQRLHRAIDGLAEQPTPPSSKQLDYVTGSSAVLYRLRIDKWRIVYAVDEDASLIRVVAIRQRPPYDYGDLETLLEDIL
jgi:mRNA interferase RelE/StbE